MSLKIYGNLMKENILKNVVNKKAPLIQKMHDL